MKGGNLAYKTQNEDVLIAEGNDIAASEEFDVKAVKSGTYTVTVTGENAKGSVKFIVLKTEQMCSRKGIAFKKTITYRSERGRIE